MISADDITVHAPKQNDSGAMNMNGHIALSHHNTCISNSIENIAWKHERPRLQTCSCGDPECGTEAVRIVRLDEHILITAPENRPEYATDWPSAQPASFLYDTGAIVISNSHWQDWSKRYRNLPCFESFPRANRSDILRTWLLEAGRRFEFMNAEQILHHLKHTVVSGEEVGPDEAVAAIEEPLRWLAEQPETEIQGDLYPISDTEPGLERLYFGGPSTEDWYPYLRSEGICYCFGRSWALSIK